MILPLICLAVTQSDRPWVTVRLQFVQCADDDGKRSCDFKWSDVPPQLAIANQVYSVAHVRFIADEKRDFAHVRNSALNSIDVAKSPYGDRSVIEANKLAAKYRGKVIILCRFGAGAKHTGTGFSGGDLCEVNLPSPRHTNAGSWMLAHEMGHYFGLSHTFRSRMRSVAQAEEVLKTHGGDLNIFDGDGFSDTPVDPGFSPPKGEPRDFVMLNGEKVPIPYGNIMSYMSWSGHEWMSAQQADRVREVLASRQRVGMGWQSNQLAAGLLEAEDLSPTYQSGCQGGPDRMPHNHRWSGDQQLECHGPIGASVTLHFHVDQDETANLTAYMTMARSYGIVQFRLDGARIGREFDEFSRDTVSSGPVKLGQQVLEAGDHELEIRVTGKVPSARDHAFGVDGITISVVD